MKQLKTIMATVCLLTGGMLMAMSEKEKYKKGTLHMVKRLALLDHNALVPELKRLVFKKVVSE